MCCRACSTLWRDERDIKMSMSAQGKVRPQDQKGAGARKAALWCGIVLLFAAAYLAGWYRKNHRYDSFARCVASKQARMYGLYWCPHCADQKEMFGRSFQYVPYTECALQGSHELAPQCKAAGASLFPSWQFAGGPLQPGVLSLDDLSRRTGCGLP
jgi:hypothetical protein